MSFLTIRGHGDGPTAPALRTPPADLTRIAQRRAGHFPVAEIAAFIDGRTVVPAHGSREMPIWGDAFLQASDGYDPSPVREKIRQLTDYIASLQKPRADRRRP